MEEFDDQELPGRPKQLDFSGRTSDKGGNTSRQTGRAAKMRLLSLMGLLLLVIVAMKEAGKPERWMWLGFEKPSDPALVSDAQINDQDIVLEAASLAPDSNAELNSKGLGYMPDRIASRLNGPGVPQKNSDTTSSQDPQQTPVAVDFWRATFLKLRDPQQEAFYQLLRRIDTARLEPPRSDLPLNATIERLGQFQVNHQSKTLAELAVMPQGDQKNVMTENLFAFDRSWQKQILPSLKASAAGEDFSLSDQTAIRSVRTTIDPIVLKNVEDMTGIGNPRDKLAWLAIWDFVQRDAETLETRNESKTTLLQLKGQPQAFRGQTTTITGTAHTIRRRPLKRTLLNLDQYYELWIDPPERVNDGLICVYVATLPNGFDSVLSEVTDKFQDIRLPVTVAGRFFKLRSYQDGGKAVSHCPVVIAETFTANFRSSESDGAALSWRPSLPLMLAFLGIAGLAAIGIAYGVFKSTQSGTGHKSKPVSKRLGRSLDALADDETVMTDAERVAELNQRLEEDYS